MSLPKSFEYISKKEIVNAVFNKLDYALLDVLKAFDMRKIKMKTYKSERSETKYFLLIEIDEKSLED